MNLADLCTSPEVPDGLQESLSKGDFPAALVLTGNYLIENPNLFLALKLNGYCLLQAGKTAEALVDLTRAVTINSRDSVCLNLLGNCLVRIQKRDEAVNVFRRAAWVDKECADSRNNLGMALAETAKTDEAIIHFQKALELDPAHERARVNLLGLYLSLGRYEEAHRFIEGAPALNPVSEEFLSLSCDVYFKAAWLSLAEQTASRLVEQYPSRMAHDRLNRCFLHQRNHAAFVKCTLEISHLYPNEPSSVIHAVTALMDIGDRDRSRTLLAEELQKNPGNVLANVAYAYDQLHRGDWCSGWNAYEFRLLMDKPQIHFHQSPRWDGSTLEGRRVLVLCEQGVGDVVFFARFLKLLLSEAEDVQVLCEQRFRGLLERNFPQIAFVSDPALLGTFECDTSIALGSLGKAYGTRWESVAMSTRGYLRAGETLSARWRGYWERSVPFKSPRIGFSINAGLDEYNRHKRACPFPAFLELWPSASNKMIDLDHFGDEDYAARGALAAARGVDYVSLMAVTKDLEQLCACISQLDLVITTQQTNAHICGACGVPCIVMLPPNPHFVYGYDGDSTPWYSSLHLVRAKGWYRWEELADTIRDRVMEILGEGAA